MQEQLMVDGVVIKPPKEYKPVFSTTSTEDSDRTQDLVMHNTPMGTISGYDMTWGNMTWAELATILNSMLNKSSFMFHHASPLHPNEWIDEEFYAASYNMAAQTLKDNMEKWTGLTISVRSINPV